MWSNLKVDKKESFENTIKDFNLNKGLNPYIIINYAENMFS